MKALTRTLVGFLLTALLMYALACAVLWKTQRSYLYFPAKGRQADVPVVVLQRDDVRVLVSTHEVAGPQAVLYLGGNAEDVSRALGQLQTVFPQAAIYALHYRGYGGSGGSPTEAALVGDALALFDRIHREHPQVRVIGRSLGSGIAVHLASLRPVQALVLVTPYNSIAGLAAQQFAYFPTDLLVQDRYDSGKYAKNVTAPTQLILAGNDRVIPRASSLELLDAFAPGVAHAQMIPGVGHNDISQSPDYEAALAR
jgi:pimeloyl-ACP methyl ester carboxylesterase